MSQPDAQSRSAAKVGPADGVRDSAGSDHRTSGASTSFAASVGNGTTKADVRKLKAHLRDLSAAVTTHLQALDETLTFDRSVPNAVGKRLAQLANDLDLANDRVRYFALGVDYRTDRKGRR